MIDVSHNSRRAAGAIDTVVIGAGHAGLATSYCLSERGIDHVVLERGEVANSWRKERWDSLRLLTPNWQSRLPGYAYQGDDPDGFMSMSEVVDFIQSYADVSGAPVQTNTTVRSVKKQGQRYSVATSAGQWDARSVVIASGACNESSLPAVAAKVPEDIESLTPHQYRNPGQLRPGGVLVVGASATGLQLADEIRQAGHTVTIAVGEHVRMPRQYRGHDIQFWLDRVGILNERFDEVDDVNRARRLPSPQLVGSADNKMLDLNYLAKSGVRLAGRFMGINNGLAQFSGSLSNVCKLADLKMNRMLDSIDRWLESDGAGQTAAAKERFAATHCNNPALLSLPLNDGSICTIIWATGFRPDYHWLDVPILDRKGRIQHKGGITESDGLYVIGLPMLRRRKSSFIHGVEDDARDLTTHLKRYLRRDEPYVATIPPVAASMGLGMTPLGKQA